MQWISSETRDWPVTKTCTLRNEWECIEDVSHIVMFVIYVKSTILLYGIKMATPYPHNTDYIVYPNGRVWTTKKKRFMKAHKDNSGYLHISFYMNKKKTTRLLHRVVLETFDGPCPEGMEARHLDGDKENNNILNLVWGTREENMEDVKEYYKRTGGQNNANAK